MATVIYSDRGVVDGLRGVYKSPFAFRMEQVSDGDVVYTDYKNIARTISQSSKKVKVERITPEPKKEKAKAKGKGDAT